MSTIEALLHKPLHEMTNEELANFARTRRRDITAIIEMDIDGTRSTKVGTRTAKKTMSTEELAELEDNL
jgi:hypothetical protein